jgi:hypothetical protein
MMTSDLNGNALSGAAALTRLGRNFAPGMPNGALIGTPTPNGPYASFTHTAFIDTLQIESKNASILALFRTNATLVGNDIFPIFGNYVSAALGSLQLYYTAGGTLPAGILKPQATYNQTTAASFVGSISAGLMTVTAVNSGTLTLGAHLLTGAGLTYDTTIGTQVSGATGGAGVYNVSRTDQTVAAGTTITSGTVVSAGPTLTIPIVANWQLVCMRVTDGVGITTDVLTTGTSVARSTYAQALPRSFPNPGYTMTAFGSRSTAIQGGGDGIAYAYANRAWTDAEMNDNANQLRAYATNRALAA